MASKKSSSRGYGYVRVSTDEQFHEGLSIDLQKDRIEAYAKAHGITLIKIFEDGGESGKDLERPAMKELLELVQGDQAEAIIVYKLDRLTRSTRDLLYLVEDVFLKSNTRFLSITEAIDTETAMGKFFLTIMGALGQMERELIAERTKAALALKKERGERLGTTPYGFKTLPDGTLEVDEEQMKVVLEIKRMRRRGMKFRAIARKLNEKEVPAKRGGEWHGVTVSYLCKNRRYKDYLGEWRTRTDW